MKPGNLHISKVPIPTAHPDREMRLFIQRSACAGAFFLFSKSFLQKVEDIKWADIYLRPSP